MITPKLFGFTDMSQVKHVPFYLALSKGYHFWETGFYFGIPALILGLIGIAKNYRSRLSAFLIFAAVIGFLHALGSNGFLFKILFYLPGFDKFRFPARTIYYLVFGFSVFAGFGYDAIAKNKEKLEIGKKILENPFERSLFIKKPENQFEHFLNDSPRELREIASICTKYR